MADFYTLMDVLQRDSKFSTLCQAINDAGLVESLRKPGPFTIFAPTNNAFAKLPSETLTDLHKEENKSKFAELLNYHLIPGKVMSDEIIKLKTAKTIHGKDLTIELKDGLKINGARLLARNVEASNGIIHAIDTVLNLKVAATV